MEHNLLQVWLMLLQPIRVDESVVILDRDDYNAIRNKIDDVLSTLGLPKEKRAEYSLGGD